MADTSFPYQARLRTASEYGQVFRNAIGVGDACFRVLARPNGLAFSRLGLAVSRKVDKRAVQRNRIKRVIREQFRTHQTWLASTGGLDIVVVARQGCSQRDNAELLKTLEILWRRLLKKTAAAAIHE